MRRRIAFLHTSPVHVETFERLTRAADPTVEVEHVVAEDPLADAQRVGASDPALMARVHQAMAKAASGGASLVVCTCSTIGGSAERTPKLRDLGVEVLASPLLGVQSALARLNASP